MIKRISTILFAGILGTMSYAQMIDTTMARGTLLEMQTIAEGATYQWQTSSDLLHFMDIPRMQTKKLGIRVFAPKYYRLKVVDKNSHIFYSDTVKVNMTSVDFSKNHSVTGGGHGYLESLDRCPDAKGINIPTDHTDQGAGNSKKLTKWDNGQTMAVYYLHHPQGIVDTKMALKLKANSTVEFCVRVWDPTNMDSLLAENYIALKGSGEQDTVSLIGVDVPKSAYYRYELSCLKGWKNIIEISKFYHYAISDEKTYKPRTLASPAIHISDWKSTDPRAPQGNEYDWCYLELMLPSSSDYPHTYLMGMGILGGYMGIQMNGYENSNPRHDVLFSMWDDGSTDKDPNLPMYLRANVLDHNKQAAARRFGSEGTGMQTPICGNMWKAGKYVQLLTNSRKEKRKFKVFINGREHWKTQYNTLVSAWFNAQDGKGWQYISTLRKPNTYKNFKSWYSFIEIYLGSNGQAIRKGYYRNGYGRSLRHKNWFHFNKVKFSHTDNDGRNGDRYDYAYGVSDLEDGAFFVRSGGYLPTAMGNNEVPLNTDNTSVDTINLDVLSARVDQAIENEKREIENENLFQANKLDNSSWKIINFSSEETNGEGKNGLASLIIDGDLNTYWHSKWTSTIAKAPHFIVVDMQNIQDIMSFKLIHNGKTDRYVKSFNLYASLDNVNWKKIYTNKDVLLRPENLFTMDHAVKTRYLKIEITESRDSYQNRVRLAEFEVSRKPKPTSIEKILSTSNNMRLFVDNGELYVKVPIALKDAEFALYNVNGKLITSVYRPNVRLDETVKIPMAIVPKGAYIIKCESLNYSYTKQFIY